MEIEFDMAGFDEMEAALFELRHTTSRAVARRAMREVLEPVADLANDLAPVDLDNDREHKLSESYVVGSRLSQSQRREASSARRVDEVTMHVGTTNPAGVPQEFGTVNHGPQPHLRPAWDAHVHEMLTRLGRALMREASKSLARVRRRG